ncbi:hypothetical protein [Dongia sedimenti]|uniref:Uncharacterized protein n=1 Tax=Dongia sedimenti TaxID=3064282 RepID=A0ABU0YPD4_9PROT|nr:hypothetical protein [Rhodospirillaceae bacterium R-7]
MKSTKMDGFGATRRLALLMIAAFVTAGMGRPSYGQDGQVFKAPPAGYRLIGFAIGEGLTMADFKTPRTAKDAAIGDAFAGEVIKARSAAYVVNPSACTGTGEDPTHPIVPTNLPSARDQVRAGIACSLLRFPHPIWNGAQLIVKGEQYLSVVTSLDKKMRLVEAYTDVSQFVATIAP